MDTKKSFSVELGGKIFSFETGALAFQADGAVLARFGELVILSTCGLGAAKDDTDFFPLTVEFEPRFYASGRIKFSKVNKREGRRSDRDILSSRVTDRPLRPLFPKGMRNDVQIINTLLQTDGLYSVAPSCITASSLAIQLAGLPFEQSVAGVQIGMNEKGELILFPTYEEVEKYGFDVTLAGTEDAILMVEAGAPLVTNEVMVKALEMGHEAIKKLCRAQDEFLKQFSIEARECVIRGESETYAAAYAAVEKIVSQGEIDAISGTTKKAVKAQMKALEDRILETCASEIEAETLKKSELIEIFEKKFAQSMRKRVFSTGKRVDGRGMDDVRPISVTAGVFSRLHGSALFQRGETQVLSVLTLAGPDDELLVSDADRPDFHQRYIHHYNFPPYSVGEVKSLRGPGRREIGHGALAERALRYVVPQQADGFMYTMRVVSEVLSCNGSSSMASVCGSTLALMDGGIPIKTPIAGVAMGLMMEEGTGDYRILTDIQGLEDFDGDMDFKVTGNEDLITCLQLDIKIKGLKMSLLVEALEKAQVARRFILGEMKKVIAAPRSEMSSFAPLITTVKVREDQISLVIGKGGETIQGMEREFGVDISIADDGTVAIAGKLEGITAAKQRIILMTKIPEVGDVFENATVKTVVDFGAFVEFLPKQEALLHVSAFGLGRIQNPAEHIKVGDKITVKISSKDDQGRFKLEWVR